MTRRLLATAGNLSEFITGRHGDCGELATLAALHVVRPDAYALDGASLERVNRWAIANHRADNPDGAETMSGVGDYLASVGLHFTVEAPEQLRALLAEWAGLKAIIVEYANAQALPGDEAGVHFHFNTCLGGDPELECYLFADGDNSSVRITHGRGPLDSYTWSEIAAAQPYAVLLVEDWPMIDLSVAEVARYFSAATAPDGSPAWHCAETGCLIRGGMLAYYRSLPSYSNLGGLYALGLPITNEIVVPPSELHAPPAAGAPIPTVQRFERGSLLYDPQQLVDTPPDGCMYSGVYPAHVNLGIGRS